MPAQNSEPTEDTTKLEYLFNHDVFKEDGRDYLFLTITYKQDPNIGVRTPCALKDQFNQTVPEVIEQMDICCDYILVPEYTLNSRIHYHAILKIKPKCKAKYYKMMSCFKRLGFCSSVPVVNLFNVNQYIHKDVDMMMDILGISLPISSGTLPVISPRIKFE